MKRFPVIAATLMLTLSGCVSIGPKLKPVQMYRFVFDPTQMGKSQPAPPAADVPPIGIVLGTIIFPQDSSGDRITTIEGNEVSYVAQSRWTAPAQELFNEAVGEGFARSAISARLEARGPSAANYRLDIVVRQFESVYSHNRPSVAVAFDARIIRLSDKAVVGERFITEDVNVGHNDMSLMADTYTKATSQAVGELIGFTQTTLATEAAAPTPSPTPPTGTQQKVEGL